MKWIKTQDLLVELQRLGYQVVEESIKYKVLARQNSALLPIFLAKSSEIPVEFLRRILLLMPEIDADVL